MKINKPEFIFYTSATLLFITLISAAFHYSSIQQDDAVRINLAGRQRMLSQKIVKELLLYSSNEVSRDRVIQSVNIFSQTQNALINGGPAPMSAGSEKMRTLSQIQEIETLNKLLEVEEMWESVQGEIFNFISKKNRNSLKYVISRNEIFLDKIEESVYALQKKSENNSLILQIIIILLVLIILSLFIIIIYRKVKEVREADKRIKELETLLPICSSCKKIRTNNDEPKEIKSWTSIEEYLRKNNEMIFTHTICPDCKKKLYPDLKE